MTTTEVRRMARETPLAFFPDAEPTNEAMLLAHDMREEVLQEYEFEAPFMTVILSHSATEYADADVWVITDPEHINNVQAAIVGKQGSGRGVGPSGRRGFRVADGPASLP